MIFYNCYQHKKEQNTDNPGWDVFKYLNQPNLGRENIIPKTNKTLQAAVPERGNIPQEVAEMIGTFAGQRNIAMAFSSYGTVCLNFL